MASVDFICPFPLICLYMQRYCTDEGSLECQRDFIFQWSARFFVNFWQGAPGTLRGRKLEISAWKIKPLTLT